ncbi:hypothetical protein EKM05_09435 [Flavobacterium sp. GSP27]|uniref:DUF6089 domain-containing protein n=2 Tax=Flavobacterium TaxID=237 RepID=A0A3S0PH45_9FLAO|nr:MULTISPECIES: DUF6089 family protein [Flavobacterium]RTY95651.1 hypothetical protein EKL32_06510 [Flavobacterium sp. GSN2]RTY83099.1 hypothetical protein EKL99_05845 [Flavobacterium sp. ZB4P23]RTY84228.1 hypothetical protein EKL97_02855 [Flavobacterium sp. LS1P28]RTY92972.1 hypothetical protein EKM01_02375 [Flavobacterium sp. RSP46]RTZ03155.1 hypothetical protein EKL98_11780 [Flavobacterium bomense]
MNKIFYLLFCLLPFTNTQAQIHEIGVFAGGSNFVGDVGPTTYLAPNEPAFGVLYKWNKSPRHAYRFSYMQSNINSDDSDSKEAARNQRGYRFENNLKEVSLGLEFNFFDFNLHDSRTKITPYVFSGISYFLSRYKLTDTQAGTTAEGRSERRKSIAIPMILGIKSTLSPSLILGLETGARYTLTDDIEGSYNGNFGNINNNDWYVFTGVTLTYTFGNKPCYCAE